METGVPDSYDVRSYTTAGPQWYVVRVGPIRDAGKTVGYALDDAERDAFIQSIGGRAKPVVTRFKGLGEMSPLQLRETTMDPATRRLVQLTDLARRRRDGAVGRARRLEERREEDRNPVAHAQPGQLVAVDRRGEHVPRQRVLGRHVRGTGGLVRHRPPSGCGPAGTGSGDRSGIGTSSGTAGSSGTGM